MRIFIAVDLHNTEKIASLQDLIINQHKFHAQYFRPIPQDNLHLTIKFLGETTDAYVEEIITNLQYLRFESFEVRFVTIGCFPNCTNPRIIWLGLDDKSIKELNNLYHIVMKLLKEAKGVSIESQFYTHSEKDGFIPHLTIFRANRHIRLLKPLDFNHNNIYYNTNIDEIKLKKSILTSEGPIYSDLLTIEANLRK